ncbi:MAG: O-antigen ligase family protein [Clostridia bacterium]|nr:O-antigen ligase family protein [Clostridia bacterium]
MSQKKKEINSNKTSSNVATRDLDRDKWGKFAFYTLMFLGAEILICLVINLLFGNPDFDNKISDTFVTAFLQNYNYLLGMICLLPINLYLFSKIKKKLSEKYLTDSQMLLYGFFGFIISLIVVISVCSVVYPINASTLYGYNSKTTVSFFLVPVMILIIEAIVYGILAIPNLVKNKQFWRTVGKNAPIILMVMFIIWTFISCMLAPGAADTVLGDKAPKEDEILAKTLNGCYNLKDGFWAFLMYGSVMLCAALIGKDKIKEKKILIKIFVMSILVLSLITLSITAYSNQLYQKYNSAYEQYYNEESGNLEVELSKDNFTDRAKLESYQTYYKWNVFPQRSIFRNSNHFAYVLSMAVIAVAMLAITEKNLMEKLLYMITFGALTYMLIINDTFGGYLGVLIALIGILVYQIGNLILYLVRSKGMNQEEKNLKLKDVLTSIVVFLIIAALFATLTYMVRDEKGNQIAVRNINNFARDIGIFGGYMINEENATETDISTVDTSIRKAGSGRGETWLKVWELVKQRPFFGYGLECLLFQFNGQFGVNEGRTHNLLLQLLATIGIPGTIMYFAALAIIFVRLIKNWKTWNDVEKICVFVGISYMITALTGNSTYYTSPYFMMFLGFMVFTPWKKELTDDK